MGDYYNVMHPELNEWKLAYVCHISQEGYRFHIKNESSEFVVEKKEQIYPLGSKIKTNDIVP